MSMRSVSQVFANSTLIIAMNLLGVRSPRAARPSQPQVPNCNSGVMIPYRVVGRTI